MHDCFTNTGEGRITSQKYFLGNPLHQFFGRMISNETYFSRVRPNTLSNPQSIDLEAAKRALLGCMVGDSLGLPYEGLSSKRNLRLMPFPLRQRIFFGKGFTSDDTLQSVFVLQALMACEGSDERFAKEFGRRLRTWFLSIPPGIGLSTIKACLRLCVGVNALRSRVKSAGNGAAMRAAVLGAAFHENAEQRIRMVEVCSRVTHTDPMAIQGAQLIALAAALSAKGAGDDFEEAAQSLCPEWPWETGWPNRGPSGWVVHSVNAAIFLWKKYSGDPVKAMEAAISLGGDTDSVAAMLGGILGADSSVVWPTNWERVSGWPQVNDIKKLPLRVSYFRLLANHIVQLPVILLYGFRRLLPPY